MAEAGMKVFTTSDGQVFGRYAVSPSNEFLLLWRDEWAAGQSKTKGPFYLFNGETELFKGHLLRPNDGQVANNGSFIFCDWLFTDKLASVFYAFSRAGEMLIEKKLRANLFNAAISPDGLFAVCQTASNPESRHGDMLTLFHLGSRSEVWHLLPPFRPEQYEFDVSQLQLTIRGKSPVYKSCVLSLDTSKC